MAVPLDAVPLWGMDRGRGHAIQQRTPSGWALTICGDFSPSVDLTEQKPARICAKCRARLRQARAAGVEVMEIQP